MQEFLHVVTYGPNDCRQLGDWHVNNPKQPDSRDPGPPGMPCCFTDKSDALNAVAACRRALKGEFLEQVRPAGRPNVLRRWVSRDHVIWLETISLIRPPPSPKRPPDVEAALECAFDFAQVDGGHHKAWVIDQMVKALTGDGYAAFVARYRDGEDGPETYDWDTGIAP